MDKYTMGRIRQLIGQMAMSAHEAWSLSEHVDDREYQAGRRDALRDLQSDLDKMASAEPVA